MKLDIMDLIEKKTDWSNQRFFPKTSHEQFRKKIHENFINHEAIKFAKLAENAVALPFTITPDY